jgi:hypothetical protein
MNTSKIASSEVEKKLQNAAKIMFLCLLGAELSNFE